MLVSRGKVPDETADDRADGDDTRVVHGHGGDGFVGGEGEDDDFKGCGTRVVVWSAKDWPGVGERILTSPDQHDVVDDLAVLAHVERTRLEVDLGVVLVTTTH